MEERKRRFSHILWLDCSTFDYAGMVKKAQDEVAGYSLGVRRGTQITGEFGDFELLFQNIAFTWRIQ
jgi:hypothetical protein